MYPSMQWDGGVSQHAMGQGCVSQHAIGQGCLPNGGVYPGGVCPKEVSAQGGCLQGGVCPDGCLPTTHPRTKFST